MHKWPLIHEERCYALEVQFSGEHAIAVFEDGRMLGVPLVWFPSLQSASEEQRQNYISYGSSVYWEDLDDGIDITSMLTGMYIVPVDQRDTQPLPHVPRTCAYLAGGMRHSAGMAGVPFVHDTRNMAQNLRFTGDHLAIYLADGRILFLPLSLLPRLAQASENQRRDFQRDCLLLRWREPAESIDLIAMLTGFYDQPAPRLQETLAPASAALS